MKNFMYTNVYLNYPKICCFLKFNLNNFLNTESIVINFSFKQ